MSAKLLLSLLTLLFFTSCSVQLVSPYDETIYTGITDYKQNLNQHVKDMTVLGGTPAGTFQSNQLKYNALEVQIEMLIDRAHLQSNGRGCSLSPALTRSVSVFIRDAAPSELTNAEINNDNPNPYGCTERLLGLVKDQLTMLETIHRDLDQCEIRAPIPTNALTEPPAESATGNAQSDLDDLIDSAVEEVTETLKATIKAAVIDKIESAYSLTGADSNASSSAESGMISCLRPATSVDALNISNQSINAVWVLENSKKNSEG